MNKIQKNEKADAVKTHKINKGEGPSKRSENRKINQNKKAEPHHHIVQEEPKYPQWGNTNPFNRESWVY